MARRVKKIEVEQTTEEIATEIISDLIAAQAQGLAAPGGCTEAEADAIKSASPRCPYCRFHRHSKTRVEGVFCCRNCGSFFGPAYNLRMPKALKKSPFKSAFYIFWHAFF